jgi:hypothetical protein
LLPPQPEAATSAESTFLVEEHVETLHGWATST